MALQSLPYSRLAFGLSGSIGNAVTFASWHGCPIMRRYGAPPAGPSIGQAAGRRLFTLAGQSWGNSFSDPAIRSAWRSLATFSPGSVIGYDLFIRSVFALWPYHQNALWPVRLEAPPPYFILHGSRLDGLPPTDDPPPVTFRYGISPGSLRSTAIRAWIDRKIVLDFLPENNSCHFLTLCYLMPVSGLISVKQA